MSKPLVDELIRLAQVHTDVALTIEGKDVHLEEDPNLELPFMIPQDGFSCDSTCGVPPGLKDYLEPVISAGMKESTHALMWLTR